MCVVTGRDDSLYLSLANCITVCFRLMMTYDLAHLKRLAHTRLRPLCGQMCACTRAFTMAVLQTLNSMMIFRAKVLFFKPDVALCFQSGLRV